MLTPERKHYVMSRIQAKDTKPEMIVRQYLWSRGFRYRLYNPRLPGKPDLVLRKYRTCIFINGCFWHGHDDCSLFKMPKTNLDYWTKKIERNKSRDIAVQQQLAKMGWHCITIWECSLKSQKREKTLESLEFTLNHIYLQDHSVHRMQTYSLQDNDEIGIVAEEIEHN